MRKALDCPGEAREDWRIVCAMAQALGADWPEYESPEDVWNEFADLSPNWYGIRYPRLEEHGIQWPCTDLDHPGTPYLHAPQPALPGGRGRFFPVEYQPPIEQPDSEYPLVLSTGRTLYHYNSATMTMREAGVRREAGGGRSSRSTARTPRRSGSPTARSRGSSRGAASSRPRRTTPSVSTRARLDGAPLRAGEGELAASTTSATR